jgi:hypothetical protein
VESDEQGSVSIEGSTYPFSEFCIEEIQHSSVVLSRYMKKLGL